MDTQWKWNTAKEDDCGVYNTITKWNYYLKGSDIIMCNDHKPLQKFLNCKNTNNKVNWWSMELSTYIITLNGYLMHNQSSRLPIEVPGNDAATSSILINSITASPANGSTTYTHSKTKAWMEVILSETLLPSQPDTTKVNASQLIMGDCKDTLFQMQSTDVFYKCISTWLLNGKHLTMKLTLLLTSMIYSINMPFTPLRNFSCTSHPKS